MTEKLLENLKELKKIRPDRDYSSRSRALIMSVQREKSENWLSGLANLFYETRFKMAASIAIVLIFAAGGGFYYANKMGKEEMVVKASEINSSIQVNLYGIKYMLENQPDINPLMVPNMQKLLEEANENMKQASELSKDPSKMKETLEKIEAAQEIFQKINYFFK